MRQTAILSLLMLLLLCGSASAQQSIIGKWEGYSPEGDIISYEFKEDNSVIWILDIPNFPGTITARYTVDYSTKPIQLNMSDYSYDLLKGFKFVGIVEFLSPTKIKIDGVRAKEDNDEVKRPERFTWQAIEFDKVE